MLTSKRRLFGDENKRSTKMKAVISRSIQQPEEYFVTKLVDKIKVEDWINRKNKNYERKVEVRSKQNTLKFVSVLE